MDEEDKGMPKSCLMDGDYCSETIEDYNDEYIPYSLWLLMQQKKKQKMMKRNELTDNKL